MNEEHLGKEECGDGSGERRGNRRLSKARNDVGTDDIFRCKDTPLGVSTGAKRKDIQAILVQYRQRGLLVSMHLILVSLHRIYTIPDLILRCVSPGQSSVSNR